MSSFKFQDDWKLIEGEFDRINKFCEMMDGVVSQEVLDWLVKHRFFRQPASTRFHGAYVGGLFDHSYAVAKNLLYLTDKLELKWERSESPKIVGMFHDVCKIDQYAQQQNGMFKHIQSAMKGHGDKSVVIANSFIKLTEEEKFCIWQHMGAFVDSRQWSVYTDAVKKYPNVLWTHSADMMASNIEGV